MTQFLSTLLLTAALLPGGLPTDEALAESRIPWQPDFEQAFDQARESGRVVFLAVNMDGEKANDRMVKELYTDPLLVKLAGRTTNLVASISYHNLDGPCKRLGSITCDQHRAIDAEARDGVLQPTSEGWVVAPQHLFFKPDGTLLLSVPYAVSNAELEWCFVRALREIDPDFEWELSERARAPKRLILGGVFDATGQEEDVAIPPSEAEAKELMNLVSRNLAESKSKVYRQLMTVDYPDVLDFIQVALRKGPSGKRGTGRDRRPGTLHDIGIMSPPSYWEIVSEHLDNSEAVLQIEAAVALEQLAAPEAVKEIRKALSKERDPAVAKHFLRALGACGGDDKNARKQLVKSATSEKDALLRVNAIVALGWLTPDEELRKLLVSLLVDGRGPDREAAACAMALTREAAWLRYLRPTLEAAKNEKNESLQETCERTIGVLEAGDLRPLKKVFMRVTGDEIELERVFGS